MKKSLLQTVVDKDAQSRVRNAKIILGILMLAAILIGALFGYLGYTYNQPQLYVMSGMLAANLLAAIWLFVQIGRGKTSLAVGLLISFFLADVLAVIFFVQNVGLIVAVSAVVMPVVIAGFALSSQQKPIGIISGVLAGGIALILDAVLGAERFVVPQMQAYTPFIAGAIFMMIFFVIIQEFKNFSLRVKVAVGIITTGTIVVLTLTAFTLSRANLLIVSVAEKFEGSALAQIENEVSSTAQKEAQTADSLFDATVKNLQAMAAYRENLESHRYLYTDGSYWNAEQNLFKLPGGQYGNYPTDAASIFIPNTVTLNQTIFEDLNTTAYLDFIAKDFLKANPRVSAVYYISKRGATTYYPNISLAELVPPDFETVSQPFFTIAAPQNNPQREPRWTDPYQDPAGTGLVVTLSIPIYSGGDFKGVLGADLQLAQITEEISGVKLGENGFSFLVDESGRILAMPPYVYSFFGLQPENVEVNQSPQTSILDINRTGDISRVMRRIADGEIGLEQVEVNGADYYVSFAPLQTVNYRVAVFASKDELGAAIVENRRNIEAETRASAQDMVILLITLFFLAGGISFLIGQVVTSPLIRLTQTVERIAEGDMSARAVVETLDETGRLAASVNKMNDELKNVLASLEQRISERTSEIEQANEVNVHRAALFETIARVARAISSAQTMDALLPQVVDTISRQFGFYHVGIFLMDSRHQYAILVAANSEGGKRMLARNHRLRVGESGIVGYVTSLGQPRVALDVGADATYFNNPDLPDTRSEMALPLRIGADTFGALDVQSVEPNAFSQEDINILSTLADQVSIAIQNARSYQQSRDALAQAEKVSFQLSGQQWRKFTEQQTVSGYYFDGAEIKAIADKEKREPRPHNISIPLTLRGVRIGSIKINALKPDYEWTDDELVMVQATADRAALALENARLLEESQKRAVKERTIGEISAKISGLTDVESILQTAMRELGANLPSADIAVQFTDEVKQSSAGEI